MNCRLNTKYEIRSGDDDQSDSTDVYQSYENLLRERFVCGNPSYELPTWYEICDICQSDVDQSDSTYSFWLRESVLVRIFVEIHDVLCLIRGLFVEQKKV